MAENKKSPFSQIEEDIIKLWASEKTFEKSLNNRKDAKQFSFYDGPPFANGMPHYGHLLQTTIKDAVTRYKTMQGYYVPRRIGWDTHGLPVEYAIEKEHDFKGKRDILAYGIDKFNAECRQSVYKYKDEWEKMFHRVGRWADYEKTYSTLDESYIESVWWAFKTIYDKGLVYKDFRSSPYCPRCATPLSNFELNQGYKDDIEDPSLFVKFKLVNEDAYLLGWTTTPWSLPGNAAIAVKPDARYVYVELTNDDGRKETVIVANERLEALNLETFHVTKEVNGSDLIGMRYEPLFKIDNLKEYDNQENLYKVWGADFVSIEDGSGVLHVAPAFGEDDLLLSKQNDIPVFLTVDENGHIQTGIGLPEQIAGKFFKSADEPIILHLSKEKNVYAAETIKHTYPFCWRCDTPLLYYATDSWLIKVTEIKDRLVTNNKKINWTPDHIREGRFGKWLENARDWAISRNRFWGAPLPIWATDDGEIVIIGSVNELKERAVDPKSVGDLHRPYIDDVEITTDSGKIAKRIPEVFDCWFESGAMPYAQDHYPFEDSQNWENRFPADFIAEAIDQTRGWFYTLHVLASALFDKPAFKNVICSGWIVAADGEKLSKRKKNYAPMDEIFDKYGVDSLRFFMANSPIVNGEDVRFSVDYLQDVQRKVFMTLNNSYKFYKLYADIDGWKPKKPLEEPSSENILDRWMIARLNQIITGVTASMDNYRLDKATRPLVDLLDDLSNWYIRRSRRRYWKTEDDSDKNSAYDTLHYVLLRVCQLLAPFSPFLVDYIWRDLCEGTDLSESVHLSDWPQAGKPDKTILKEMAEARDYINEGLSQRAEAGIRVRQPLQSVTIPKLSDTLIPIITEELNVKKVIWGSSTTKVVIVTTLTDELKIEGTMRDLIRAIQNARKNADLNVEDRIILSVITDSKHVMDAIVAHKTTILAETLGIELETNPFEGGFTETVNINGNKIDIHIKKAVVKSIK